MAVPGGKPGAGFWAPRDPLEQQLVNLWEQIFGVAPIVSGTISLRSAGIHCWRCGGVPTDPEVDGEKSAAGDTVSVR